MVTVAAAAGGGDHGFVTAAMTRACFFFVAIHAARRLVPAGSLAVSANGDTALVGAEQTWPVTRMGGGRTQRAHAALLSLQRCASAARAAP